MDPWKIPYYTFGFSGKTQVSIFRAQQCKPACTVFFLFQTSVATLFWGVGRLRSVHCSHEGQGFHFVQCSLLCKNRGHSISVNQRKDVLVGRINACYKFLQKWSVRFLGKTMKNVPWQKSWVEITLCGALHECYKHHSLKRTVEKWQTKMGKCIRQG